MNNYNDNSVKSVGEQISKNTPLNEAVKLAEKKVEKVEDKEIKNNTLNIVVGIMIAVGVLFILFYLGRSIINKQNKIVAESDYKEYKGEIVLNGNTCFDLENYFVVTREEIIDTGENILVKYKTEEKEFECDYAAQEGDFELLHERTENSKTINFAQYYSSIEGSKMIVDRGTGTKREFQIYDLNTKEIIFTDDYNLGLENLDLKDNILTYWRTTNDIPNKENCSKLDEYNKIGGAKIEAQISLDINDLAKKEFQDFRCSQAE